MTEALSTMKNRPTDTSGADAFGSAHYGNGHPLDRGGADVTGRAWIGDLDDLQQFVDVVEDGTVTPDDVAVARDAIRALHDTLAGRAG